LRTNAAPQALRARAVTVGAAMLHLHRYVCCIDNPRLRGGALLGAAQLMDIAVDMVHRSPAAPAARVRA
jgi:hypothetical protein